MEEVLDIDEMNAGARDALAVMKAEFRPRVRSETEQGRMYHPEILSMIREKESQICMNLVALHY